MENTTKTLKTLKRNISASIVGVSWKRMSPCQDDEMEDEDHTKENSSYDSSKTKNRRRSMPGNLVEMTNDIKDGAVSRVQFVRNAFGSMRQKLRSSTKRRKRLFALSSPYCTPVKEITSPGSAQRKSLRIAGETPDTSEIQMYSPFKIDTPSKTPKIRMGTHHPKRLNVNRNSPRQFKQDMETVSEALKLLNQNSNNLNSLIEKQGSGIITTPGGRKTPTQHQQQIFV